MKLVIASDIHGSATCAEKLMQRIAEERPDRIVLLGDLLYHGPRNPLPEGHNPARVAELLNEQAERIVAVRGNCDAEVDQMMLGFPCMADYAQIVDAYATSESADATDRKSTCTVTLFFTHGHVFSPDDHPALPPHSIFFSGHTHVKELRVGGVADTTISAAAADTANPTAGATAGVLYVNPGSLSLPKDGTRSFSVYENGSVTLKDLDGSVLAEAHV